MRNKELCLKYLHGRHWDHHPTIYAESFANFLQERNFQGLAVDLGCGSGRDVNVFQQRGLNAVGIDNSHQEVEAACVRYPHCCFEVQNIEKMAFRDHSIGAMYMINVFHYVDQEKALQEAWRVLRPGGWLFLHCNLLIVDAQGNVDYQQAQSIIAELIRDFRRVASRQVTRVDQLPFVHTHTIAELILRKP
jgi:ubiquinone/menaquinone biosynthesis C-methylase UbiE